MHSIYCILNNHSCVMIIQNVTSADRQSCENVMYPLDSYFITISSILTLLLACTRFFGLFSFISTAAL